jgi:hypothetical protein
MSERWAVPGGTPRLKERSTRQLRTGLLSDRPWRDAASKRALHAALRTGLLSDRPCRDAPPKRTLHPGTSYRAAFVMSLIGSAKLFINLAKALTGPRTYGRADTPTCHSPRRDTYDQPKPLCYGVCLLSLSVRDLRLRQSRILWRDQILALHCRDWVRAIIGCVKGARAMIAR